MKVLTPILSVLILGIILFSCTTHVMDTPEIINEKICIYKINAKSTNGQALGSPYKVFIACDDKINAHKYTGLIIEECECN